MMTGPQILSFLTPFRHTNSPNPHELTWSVQVQFIHKCPFECVETQWQ